MFEIAYKFKNVETASTYKHFSEMVGCLCFKVLIRTCESSNRLKKLITFKRACTCLVVGFTILRAFSKELRIVQ